MSTPMDGQGQPDIHEAVTGTADFQNTLHSIFAAFGLDTSALEPAEGDDTGQYFELDPAQARADMKRVQQVIDKAKDLLQDHESNRQRVFPPAADDSSRGQARSSVDTIKAAEDHLKGVVKYSVEYHNKLARSVGDYDAIEQVNLSDLGRAAGGGPSGTAV